MIPTCHQYDDNNNDDDDDDEAALHIIGNGHGDDDDECEKTNPTPMVESFMNVGKINVNRTKINVNRTCQTMVREEAATAYTKYLHIRKTISS